MLENLLGWVLKVSGRPTVAEAARLPAALACFGERRHEPSHLFVGASKWNPDMITSSEVTCRDSWNAIISDQATCEFVTVLVRRLAVIQENKRATPWGNTG